MTTPSTLEVPVRTATALLEAATTERALLVATSEGAEKWLKGRLRDREGKEEERVIGLGLEKKRSHLVKVACFLSPTTPDLSVLWTSEYPFFMSGRLL